MQSGDSGQHDMTGVVVESSRKGSRMEPQGSSLRDAQEWQMSKQLPHPGTTVLPLDHISIVPQGCISV